MPHRLFTSRGMHGFRLRVALCLGLLACCPAAVVPDRDDRRERRAPGFDGYDDDGQGELDESPAGGLDGQRGFLTEILRRA